MRRNPCLPCGECSQIGNHACDCYDKLSQRSESRCQWGHPPKALGKNLSLSLSSSGDNRYSLAVAVSLHLPTAFSLVLSLPGALVVRSRAHPENPGRSHLGIPTYTRKDLSFFHKVKFTGSKSSMRTYQWGQGVAHPSTCDAVITFFCN